MAFELYEYQSRGIAEIDAVFAEGVRRILAVAPTGAGKGTMAAWFMARAVERGQRCVFLVHRREIVRDIAKRLRSRFGVRVGIVLPGERPDPSAPVQVVSVQSLLRRDTLPDADIVIADECHHYASDAWGALLARYSNALVIGFTATPERADGRPMADVFERLIVVASYSELLASGHIVPCTVVGPPHHLGIDLAQDPLDAWLRYANGSATLVYERRVDDAIALTARFNAAGVVARCIHAGTGDSERRETLERFADGSVTVVVNVFTMTEGIDVPRAEAMIAVEVLKCAMSALEKP